MSIKKIDIRNSKSVDEDRLLFETLDSLPLGEAVEVIYDHDPVSLYDLLSEEWPNEFELNYTREGPETWRVSIGRKYLSFI